MKVFWSWQSDHHGKISRHFVREVLEQAIQDLREDPDIEEAAREVELDHDRKGVPGSPDLAAIILDKIRGSDVFVADVTAVGHVTQNPTKKLINSNVAIELGYALSVLTDRALLMVLNEAYGTRDELPFDLRHKAGPITYSLTEGADRKEIAVQRARLVAAFRTALRDMISAKRGAETHPFEATAAAPDNPGRYFRAGEVLFQRQEQEFAFKSDTFIYIRVRPVLVQPQLGRAEAMQMAREGALPVPNDRVGGWSAEQNRYGVIVFDADYQTGDITSATQLFRSREIWGVDTDVLSPHHGKRGVPTGWHDHMIAHALRSYLSFAEMTLNVEPPVVVEIGLTNVDGYVLHMDGGRYWNPDWGPIQEEHLVFRGEIQTFEPAEVDRILLGVFELIFDAAGTARPENYNGYPGEVPGAISGNSR